MIKKRYQLKDEEFFRSMMFPEEDRHRYTCKPWDGSFRWFRAPNVSCIEHYRRSPTKLAPAAPKSKPAA
jgi:hypothetical protein